jgi:hydroxyquinol 1,2-dioxygenase
MASADGVRPGLGELFTEERSAEVVCASLADSPDPRLRRVLKSLVRHLHSFVKDVELTEREWQDAIAFLTDTGHKCASSSPPRATRR